MTRMNRTDLYTNVHDGLRSLLFQSATAVARTSFADAAGTARTAAGLRAMLAFLDEHAAHEDEVLMPELGRLAPGLFEQLHGEHSRVHGQQIELAALLDRLQAPAATASEREALGQRLRQRLHALIAAHLTHMAREEVEVNRVLWAHFTDAELQALEGRIVAGIAPPRAAEWFALILPAVSRDERTSILRGMQSALPPELFASLVGPARAVLGEAAWHEAMGVAV